MSNDDRGLAPLNRLLVEINMAAKSGMYLTAISMTVALPDICASLESEDGRTSAARYKEWCKLNLGQGFSNVTPEDLYSMRCGVLHNGRFGDLKHSVARIIFTPPGNNSVFTDCKINDAYFYSILEFCGLFTLQVLTWSKNNYDNPVVLKNLDRMMQYRPDGLAPYVKGMAVIA
ncbi:hypothetical protein [Sphingobium fluviale]|uniref:Uncharacterized protein n=1 Tax=Sphingobium fluviale TaxID=2506423 RepID=A0A4Q1KGD5_9SPHN|nr:hypothetical protein [Sphingobium fluviale]RXR28768.1 hypothetical protein EQG66_08595 [Sphingobium fluviale]